MKKFYLLFDEKKSIQYIFKRKIYFNRRFNQKKEKLKLNINNLNYSIS